MIQRFNEIVQEIQTTKVSTENSNHSEVYFDKFTQGKCVDAELNFRDCIIFDSGYAWYDEIAWQLNEIKEKYDIPIFPIDFDLASIIDFSKFTDIQNINAVKELKQFLFHVDYVIQTEDVMLVYLKEKYTNIEVFIDEIQKIEQKYNININFFNSYKR